MAPNIAQPWQDRPLTDPQLLEFDDHSYSSLEQEPRRAPATSCSQVEHSGRQMCKMPNSVLNAFGQARIGGHPGSNLHACNGTSSVSSPSALGIARNVGCS
eukprot:6476492-Amphidinium_carterae.1